MNLTLENNFQRMGVHQHHCFRQLILAGCHVSYNINTNEFLFFILLENISIYGILQGCIYFKWINIYVLLPISSSLGIITVTRII